MKIRRVRTYLVVIGISCQSVLSLNGHEEPHDVIHSLTHEIEDAEEAKDEKKLAELYLKRFFEYKALNEGKRALSDIQRSCHLNPKSFRAMLELGKYVKGPMADGILAKALKLARTDLEKRDAHFALAMRYYGSKGQGDLGNAALSCDRALALDKENDLSLILFKSHLLWKLGELEERAVFLKKAMGRNSSAVLRNSWIDAMIDAGKGADVRQLITKEKNESRFKSSWLIRAALCETAPSMAAKVYAQAAITEIKQRMNLDRPDVTLLMDLARAYAINGEKDKAVFYMKKAKQLSHDVWAMDELEEKIR